MGSHERRQLRSCRFGSFFDPRTSRCQQLCELQTWESHLCRLSFSSRPLPTWATAIGGGSLRPGQL